MKGFCPGVLGVKRKASTYYVKASGYRDSLNSRGKIYAYALATSEENASGGMIVTAPTCGSSGVLPAVLYHLYKTRDFREIRILRALATAGLFGNVVKANASISGLKLGVRVRSSVSVCHGGAAACHCSSEAPPRRLNMLPKWLSNTIWALRAIRFADWIRCLVSNAMPWLRRGRSMRISMRHTPTAPQCELRPRGGGD